MVRIVVALAALLLLPNGAARAEPPPRPTTPAAVQAALASIHRLSPHDHARRLDAVSAMFLGAAYQLSPLGEGPTGQHDTDPLIDFGHFDCVTYIEEVMALSWRADLAAATAELQRIRYTGGTIRYGARKHIMMAQWIPQNIAAGLVHDITRSVGGSSVVAARLTIVSSDFVSGDGRDLHLSPADRPLGRYELPIIPIGRMLPLSARVPHGTVITSIRRAVKGRPYRASHVGLVVIRDGERRVRHAYKAAGQVVEEDLRAFVARSATFRSWPVVGFNLLAVAARPQPEPPSP